MTRRRRDAAETPPTKLKGWERNPRRITDEARAGLSASVVAFGDISGIVYNFETQRLVTGHQRTPILEAFAPGDVQWEEEWRDTESGPECWGWLDTPSGRFRIRGVRWPEAKEKAANVAANNPHSAGEFTDDLDAILAEIEADDAALYEELRLGELAALDDEGGGTSGGGDDVPEPPLHVVTKRGDVWLMGAHRLLCGDGTSADDIARVCAGDVPGVTIVDPPYEVGDAAYSQHIADPSIVFGPAKVIRLIPDEWFRFERVIVRPTHHRSATTQVAHAHALIVQVGSVKKCPDDKRLTFPSIVEIGIGEHLVDGERPFSRLQRHGKPVDLFIEHLTHWTPEWEMVFDPFCGTGTTIIAAERMGRRACAIELDPERCDVIVARWEAETGAQAARAA
ncbi:MAG: DNA methyltransferase [Gemmatimonadales bacterium]|nr:DNA methyltransferase [Gemmatimonadales bacterium]